MRPGLPVVGWCLGTCMPENGRPARGTCRRAVVRDLPVRATTRAFSESDELKYLVIVRAWKYNITWKALDTTCSPIQGSYVHVH